MVWDTKIIMKIMINSNFREFSSLYTRKNKIILTVVSSVQPKELSKWIEKIKKYYMLYIGRFIGFQSLIY